MSEPAPPPSAAALIYKICPAALWHAAERIGTFGGSPDDLRDGFMHFSTADQVAETLARHFAGQSDLCLVAVETMRLGGALKWETSRGGDLFPHLYAVLDARTVRWVKPLRLGAGGEYELPNLKE